MLFAIGKQFHKRNELKIQMDSGDNKQHSFPTNLFDLLPGILEQYKTYIL
jgi:hypothetical protein